MYIYIPVENHQFHQDHTIPQAFAAMTTEPFACSQLHHVQSTASEMTPLWPTNSRNLWVISAMLFFNCLPLCTFFYGSPIPLLRKAHTAPANEAVLNPPMRSLRSLLPTTPTHTLHKAWAKRSSSVVQIPSSWKNRWSCVGFVDAVALHQQSEKMRRLHTGYEDQPLFIPTNLLGTFGHKVLLSWNKSLNSRPAAFWFHTRK